MVKVSGDVAAATDGISGDRNSEASVSANRSGRVGGVKDWTERLNCGALGMVNAGHKRESVYDLLFGRCTGQDDAIGWVH